MFVIKVFKKNNEVKQESYQGVTVNSSLANTTSFTSNNSIPNSTEDVNDSTKTQVLQMKHLFFYITRNYFRLAIVAGN